MDYLQDIINQMLDVFEKMNKSNIPGQFNMQTSSEGTKCVFLSVNRTYKTNAKSASRIERDNKRYQIWREKKSSSKNSSKDESTESNYQPPLYINSSTEATDPFFAEQATTPEGLGGKAQVLERSLTPKSTDSSSTEQPTEKTKVPDTTDYQHQPTPSSPEELREQKNDQESNTDLMLMNSSTTESPKETEHLTIYNQTPIYHHQPPVYYHTPPAYYCPPPHSSTNVGSPPPQWSYTPQLSPLEAADTPEQNDSLNNPENITFTPPTLPSSVGNENNSKKKTSKIEQKSNHDDDFENNKPMSETDDFVAEKLNNDEHFTFIKQLSRVHNSEANENLTSKTQLDKDKNSDDPTFTKLPSDDDNYDADDDLTLNKTMGMGENIEESIFTRPLGSDDNPDGGDNLTRTIPLSEENNLDEQKASDDHSEFYMEAILDIATPLTEFDPEEKEQCKQSPIISTTIQKAQNSEPILMNHKTELVTEVMTKDKDFNQPKNNFKDPSKAPNSLTDDFKDPPKAPSESKDTESPLTIAFENTTAIEKQVNMEDSLKLADHDQHKNNKKAHNRKKKEKKNQKKRIKKHAKVDKDTKDPPTIACENMGDSHTLKPPEVLSLPEDNVCSNTNDQTNEWGDENKIMENESQENNESNKLFSKAQYMFRKYCHNNHILTRRLVDFDCDHCGKEFQGRLFGCGHLGCKICDFDLCHPCYKAKPGFYREAVSPEEMNAIINRYCPKGHLLLKTKTGTWYCDCDYGSIATTNYGAYCPNRHKLTTRKNGAWACDICGKIFDYRDPMYEKKCNGCQTCDFNLCQQCYNGF